MVLRRYPALTAITSVNVAVFAALHILQWTAGTGRQAALALSVDSEAGLLTQPWRALTYTFTQWNGGHLLFNMLWLWAFGVLLRRSGASWRVLGALYAGGGVVAAAVFAVVCSATNTAGVLAGASGAVLTVLAYTAVECGRTRVNIWGTWSMQTIWLAAVLVVLILAQDIETQPLLAAAHAAGIAVGVLCGIAVRLGRAVRTSKRNACPLSSAEEHEMKQLQATVCNGGFSALSPSARERLFELTRRQQTAAVHSAINKKHK